MSELTREFVLPEEEKFTYEDKGFEFRGVKLNFKDESQANNFNGKYNVFVYRDGEAVGRFTFYTSDAYVSEVIFSGMYIEDKFRSQGVSKVMMESIFRLAADSSRYLIHARPQRKPLMAAILQNYGFEPLDLGHRQMHETVFVGRGQKNSSEILLWFPTPAKAREFANSNIADSQPYVIVDAVWKIRKAVHVVLNTDYVLLHPEKAPVSRK